MDKEFSVKDICNKIKEIESEFGWFSLRINNVKVWEILRFKLYYKIAEQTLVFKEPQSYKYDLKTKLKILPLFIKNSIVKNPFLTKKNFEILVLDHPRKVFKKLEYVDIYTKDLLEKDLKNKKVIILEKAYRGRHWIKNSNNRYYTDIIELLVEILYLFINILSVKKLKEIEKKLNKTFETNINVVVIAKKEIKKHIIRKKIYKILLKKLKIKEVFLVVSYMNLSLIDACKDLEIEVTELQHGTISEYHLGYSYSKDTIQELKLFPDKFYSFGNYWNKFIPLSEDKIRNYGFKEFFNYQIKKNKEQLDVNGKSILFISQSVIGDRIFDYAYNLSKINKKLKIKLKLHPSEFDKVPIYKKYVKESKNLELITTPLTDLYDLIIESDIVVGVFSTVIYEALSLKKRVFLIELPGIEYMEDLIERKICEKANNVIELNRLIEKNNIEGSKIEWDFF